MGMLAWLEDDDANEDAMARKRASALNTEAIECYLGKLKASTFDRQQFDLVFLALSADKALSKTDIVELARCYTLGRIEKTKKDAILAIRQERARLSLAKAKEESAGRTKLW